MTTVHVIGLWHTLVDNAHSACAFTGKVLRLPECLRPHGYKVVEYSAGASESQADEHVALLSGKRRKRLLSDVGGEAGALAKARDSDLWREYHSALMGAMLARVRKGDIVCHPFGPLHRELLQILPEARHVESGIGYTAGPFGAWRVFESEAWRHWHWGKWGGGPLPERHDFPPSPSYTWVIPNYYRLDEWPAGDGSGDYVLFAGRMIPEKGLNTIRAIIQARPDLRYVFAGGPPEAWGAYRATLPEDAQVEYVGVVKGTARAELYGRARCMLMPTDFVEPFGGSGVEAQLCGTPLIASDFGAFTETTPYRAKTLRQWLQLIDESKYASRAMCRQVAQVRYSIAAAGERYHQAFTQLGELSSGGWYKLA